MWIVAERATVLTHRRAQRTDFVTARCIEQAGQDSEHGSNVVHRRPPYALFDRGLHRRGSAISFRRLYARPGKHRLLTRRANQVHIDTIADIPARHGNSGGYFIFKTG